MDSEAEEQVVYSRLRLSYSNTQELYDEQAEIKIGLAEVKTLDPISDESKSNMKHLKGALADHIHQEETDLSAAIRNDCSIEQQQLATDFKDAKQQLQTKNT